MQNRQPAESGTPRVSLAAVVSFLLGLVSPLLLFLTGVPAVWAGVTALRSINAAEGRLRGRRLALAGIALGAAGCVEAALCLAMIVFTTLHVRGQRVECENNLRRLGSAVLRYQAINDGFFPPGTIGNAALPPDKRLSWITALPPYLEQKAKDADRMRELQGQLDPSLAWDAGPNAAVAHAPVPVCRCPADPVHDPRDTPGLTNYVGIAGVGPDAARRPLGDPLAGIFGYDRIIGMDDVKKGLRETLMATETTRDNGPWSAGGPPTVRGADPADAPYVGPDRAFGGMHPGGLNVLFADGSADFMGDGVSPRFFEDLTRLRRDEASTPP